jgi:hypothetical protein
VREIAWPIVDEEFNDSAIRQLDDADVLGFGRATYEHMAAFWPTDEATSGNPTIASRMNDKDKVVFLRMLTEALVGDHRRPRRGERARADRKERAGAASCSCSAVRA